MALQAEKRLILFIFSVFCESTFILHASPYTFTLLALTFVFPLSFTILSHTLVTHPPFLHLQLFTFSQFFLFILRQFAYLVVLFVLSLKISAALFSISSSYTSKPFTFLSTFTAMPVIFPRLVKAFICVSGIMLLYYTTFFLSTFALHMLIAPSLYSPLFAFTLVFATILFSLIYSSISLLWHLASVMSILESAYSLPMRRKSHEFLSWMMEMAYDFAFLLFVVCVAIVEAFKVLVFKVPEEKAGLEIGSGPKALIGGVLVGFPIMANLLGLLIQSIYCYAFKTYYHEERKWSALCDYLDEYLEENMPPKSPV